MKTMTLVVTLKVPDGVTQARVQTYVRDAVASWNGGMDPEDELFGAFQGRDLVVRPIAAAVKRYVATLDDQKYDESYCTERVLLGWGARGFADYVNGMKPK